MMEVRLRGGRDEASVTAKNEYTKASSMPLVKGEPNASLLLPATCNTFSSQIAFEVFKVTGNYPQTGGLSSSSVPSGKLSQKAVAS